MTYNLASKSQMSEPGMAQGSLLDIGERDSFYVGLAHTVQTHNGAPHPCPTSFKEYSLLGRRLSQDLHGRSARREPKEEDTRAGHGMRA